MTLTSIQVTPAVKEIARSQQVQVSATGVYSDRTTRDLTGQVVWSSSDTAKATIVSTSGMATGVAPGAVAVTATSGTISGTATLTVDASTLASIAITPVAKEIAKAEQAQFIAIGTFSDGDVHDLTSQVTWSSSDATKATIVAASGMATGVAPGSTTITATAASLGGIKGTATLTVDASTLTSIAVTPSTQQIARGQQAQFIAIGTFSDGDVHDLTSQVSWTSSDTTKASIVAGSGVATGLATGTTTITATAASLGGIKGTASLTVDPSKLTSITITPATASITVKGSQQFAAMGTFDDGHIHDLTAEVDWSSSDTSKATIVSTSGVATGIAAGTASITAHASKLGGIRGTATLTVSTAADPANIPTPPSDDPKYFQVMIDNRVAAAKIVGDGVTNDGKIHFLVTGKRMQVVNDGKSFTYFTWLSGGKDAGGKWSDWSNPAFHTPNTADDLNDPAKTNGKSADGAIYKSTTPGDGGYDVTLDQLPLDATGKYRVLKIPFRDPADPDYSMMGSGRVLFALGKPVWSRIELAADGYYTPVGPDINNPTTGGATRFDFMEMNCATAPKGSTGTVPVCYVNTTNVDFFSLGVAINGRQSNGITKTFGLDLGKSSTPVSDVVAALSKLTGDYTMGKQTVTVAGVDTFVRFRSPSKSFPLTSTELDATITKGFEKYKTTALSFRDGDNVLYEAKVDASNNIVFSSPTAFTLKSVGGKLPTSQEVVAAEGGKAGIFNTAVVDNTGDKKYPNVAVAWINAFLNRGVFDDTDKWKYSRKDEWYPAGGVYNQYSKTIHDYFLYKSAYGLPYDEPGGIKDNPTEPKISDCTAMTLTITID